jgi:hypothetical protein
MDTGGFEIDQIHSVVDLLQKRTLRPGQDQVDLVTPVHESAREIDHISFDPPTAKGWDENGDLAVRCLGHRITFQPGKLPNGSEITGNGGRMTAAQPGKLPDGIFIVHFWLSQRGATLIARPPNNRARGLAK